MQVGNSSHVGALTGARAPGGPELFTPDVVHPRRRPPSGQGQPGIAPGARRGLYSRTMGPLLLRSPDEHGRLHVSAASGLVALPDALIAVSDDLHTLIARPRTGGPARLLPGLPPSTGGKPGTRPPKADLEALVRLPAVPGMPHGALLALGSGSSSRGSRDRGFLQPLDAAGRPAGDGRAIDLSPLYAHLRASGGFGELNIEGAATAGDHLTLLQRGNAHGSKSALVQIDLARAALLLGRGDATLPQGLLMRTVPVDLGAIDGVRLGFGDGFALPDGRIVFSATAEATDDPARDGEILGTVLGVMRPDGVVESSRRLAGPPRKVEGVALLATRERDGKPLLELAVTTDADDPRVPSDVRKVLLPLG